jgi:hypothetical protein
MSHAFTRSAMALRLNGFPAAADRRFCSVNHMLAL